MVAATREAGDTAWFSDAVVAILPELYGTARRLTKNAADAEDLVAEAVARAWRGRESLSDSNAFRHWMHRILANTYASWWRSARVRPVALGAVVERYDVTARAQSALAGSSEEHGVDCVVVLPFVEGAGEARHHVVVERVDRLGAVQRHEPDAVLDTY